MYRVDGVSGLNVLTGINQRIERKSFISNFEVGRPSIPAPGGAFGYRSANMLSIPFRGNGAHKLSESKAFASGFLKNFGPRFQAAG